MEVKTDGELIEKAERFDQDRAFHTTQGETIAFIHELASRLKSANERLDNSIPVAWVQEMIAERRGGGHCCRSHVESALDDLIDHVKKG